MKFTLSLTGICLCLVILLASAQVTAQQGIVQIDQVSSLVSPGVIKAGENARFLFRFNNNTGRKVDISNGFRLHSPDGAIWDSTTIDTAGVILTGENRFALYFDIVFSLSEASCDGTGSDTVGVLGAGFPTRATRQLPIGYNDTALAITAWFHNTSAAGKTICIDTSFFQPGGTWKWVRIEATEYTFFPVFQGLSGQAYMMGSGYCFQIQPTQPQGQGEIIIASVSNRAHDSMVVAGRPVRWLLKYNNNTGQALLGIQNAFKVTSPDGAQWDSTTVDTLGWHGTGQSPFARYFDLVFVLQKRSTNGINPDSVMAGGAANLIGLPAGYNDSAIAITAWFHDTLSMWKHICLDTVTFFPPAAHWEWVSRSLASYYPSFGGMPNYLYRPGYGYCLQIYPAPYAPCRAIRVPAEYPTIQAAINAAHNCDTIFVSSGVYIENITFGGKQIILRSVSSRDSTIIVGTGQNAAVVTMTSGEPKGAEINGFTITGGKKGGVYCSNSSPTIRYCLITGNVSTGVDDAAGISIVGTTGAMVAHNQIYGNTAHTYGAAIAVGVTSTTNSDDTICYNVMYNNTGLGDVRILGTLNGLMIFNNTIDVTTYDGIALQGSGTINVRNNIVTSAPVWGIYKDNGQIIAEYNCLYGNASAFGGGVTPGVGNIYADPQFVDPTGGYFFLQATSPCINAGDPSPIYNDMNGSRNDMGAYPYGGTLPGEIIQLKQWTKAAGGNDHWYAILPRSLFWVEADVAARRPLPNALGLGYLATVTSAQENMFILDSVVAGMPSPTIVDEYWLGGRDIQGAWRWITGEPFAYTNWGTGEPNNVGIETALGMWGPSTDEPGTFNNSLPDSSVHSLHRFWSLIEWGPIGQDTIPHDSVLPEIFPTNEWILTYCPWPRLDRGTVRPGSIIVAYDPAGVACGAIKTSNDTSYGMMPIYRDDPYTRIDEGCQPGDMISFTINNVPVFAQPPVYWTRNGDQFEVCQFLTQKCQEIQLHTGWNLISWNVAHTGDIATLIAPFRDKVDLVLGFERGALAYDPDLVPFSTLHQVDYSHGYWFKMNGDATLRVCGGIINQFEYIPIHQGWNLVGYWPSDIWTVRSALMTVMANVQVVVGFDAGIKVFVPGQDPYNTLTSMKPGLGYWIRSLTPDILDYFFMPTSGDNENPLPIAASGGNEIGSRDWMSLYGDDITLDNQPLAENASIEVFTSGGIKIGQSTYNSGLLKFMPVYGFDAQDANASQYPKDGDVVTLFVNSVKAEPSLEWHGSGTTLELGSLTTSTQLPGQYALSQNFPNPFNPTTTVSFELPKAGHVTLTVYNMLGQRIRTLTERDYEAGQHSVEWDGRGDNGDAVASGIYLYRIDAGSFVASKKMILLK